MKKLYKKLTAEQIGRGVIFSSCLSTNSIELTTDTIHEVFRITEKDFKEYRDFYKAQQEQNEQIARLKDIKFFRDSHFKFCIERSL